MTNCSCNLFESMTGYTDNETQVYEKNRAATTDKKNIILLDCTLSFSLILTSLAELSSE